MKTDEIKLKVEGMHCGSCEMLIQDELSELDGVKEVDADYQGGTVLVKHDGKVNLAKVKKAITDLGYKVKD